MTDEKKLPDEALDAVSGGSTPLHEQRLGFDELKQQLQQRSVQKLQKYMEQHKVENGGGQQP